MYSEESLRWHLNNNVIPSLNDKAIDGIIDTYQRYKKGELKLTDPITKGTDCTVAEMLEDLKLND